MIDSAKKNNYSPEPYSLNLIEIFPNEASMLILSILNQDIETDKTMVIVSRINRLWHQTALGLLEIRFKAMDCLLNNLSINLVSNIYKNHKTAIDQVYKDFKLSSKFQILRYFESTIEILKCIPSKNSTSLKLSCQAAIQASKLEANFVIIINKLFKKARIFRIFDCCSQLDNLQGKDRFQYSQMIYPYANELIDYQEFDKVFSISKKIDNSYYKQKVLINLIDGLIEANKLDKIPDIPLGVQTAEMTAQLARYACCKLINKKFYETAEKLIVNFYWDKEMQKELRQMINQSLLKTKI